MKKLFLLALLSSISNGVFSEDIELYIGNSSSENTNKPQVLLMFDTSGSMLDGENIKNLYDPDSTYQTQGSFSDKATSYIYYAKGSVTEAPSVDDVDEERRFLAVLNSCQTAIDKLSTIGFYTGRIRGYAFKGNTGTWQELSETSGESISILDCQDDVRIDTNNIADGTAITQNINNKALIDNALVGLPNGYPVDGLGTADSPIYYTNTLADSNADWGGEVVTLYTDNYLRWEQGTKFSDGTNIGTTTDSRLDIGKRTLVNLINSVPSVDFGLMVYNQNQDNTTGPHGGRIAFGIQDMTGDATDTLVDMIENEVHAAGWTPLCESLYEAAQYFGGKALVYGDTDITKQGGGGWHYHDKPDYDDTIITNSKYEAPYGSCSNEVFVILITDGIPTRDNAANSAVLALSGLDSISNGEHLIELARYMHNNDINDDLADDQISTLFTVGFSGGASSALPLLESAAEAGGGEFYDATDPTKLGASLQQAISSILEVNTTFTAPSVASNSFDRTETLDAAYYAMFIPGEGASWRGNLKKLKLVGEELVDADGNNAIDGDTGNIKSTATTYWSKTTSDGNDVRKGGVVDTLTARTEPRVLYSDIGGDDGASLADLTFTSAKQHYNNSDEEFANALGVEEDDLQEYFAWALGYDVDDFDDDDVYAEMRADVFGDPLHSKPLVINYGGSKDSPNIRIVIGTNSGAFHMFEDKGDTVEESWAFMPKEFFSKIKVLKDNLPSSSKEYAIDGPATIHLYDSDGNGSIDHNNDRAWVFFGLRRGGTSYYGMDITKPDSPSLLWHIDANSTGFDELGQSWSQPRVTYSSINIVNGEPKPVLIFGAGYDIAKDAGGTPGADEKDSVGKGIYMVDAEEGTLLWSLTSSATDSGSKNTNFPDIADSIPASIAVLDSDTDGLTDRLYFGDTGGNVWRVDMPGSSPFSGQTPWTVFKLAELGGLTNADDRRFFTEPSIARTFFTDTLETKTLDADGNQTGDIVITQQERPYDAILIGSGDRTTPTSIDTNDKFFLLKDENIVTQSFIAGGDPEVPTAFLTTDLYDFTDNPFGPYTLPVDDAEKAALETLELAVGQTQGWYYDFLSGGEKGMADAIVIDGVAYFTSFLPGDSGDPDSCSLVDGSGFLYAVDMYRGRTVYDWRKIRGTNGIPDTPTIIVTPSSDDGGDDGDDDDGSLGKDESTIKLLTGGKVVNLDLSLKTSQGYIYVSEDQQ